MTARVRPWFKVFRRCSARFEKLHPYTQGIALNIMRYADDDGRIPLEGATPVEAIKSLLGGDRRMANSLPGDVAELLRIGMLEVDGDYLTFPSFERIQDERPTSSVRPQCDVSRTSVRRQSDVSRASVVPHLSPNSAQLFNSGPGEKRREEESRVDEERESAPPASVPPDFIAAAESDIHTRYDIELPESRRPATTESAVIDVSAADRIQRSRTALVAAYKWRWEKAAGDMWPGAGRGDAALNKLAAWFANHPAGPGHLDRVLDAYFASPDPYVRDARWALGLLAKDPGRYLAAAKRPPARGGYQDPDPHEAFVETEITDDLFAKERRR